TRWPGIATVPSRRWSRRRCARASSRSSMHRGRSRAPAQRDQQDAGNAGDQLVATETLALFVRYFLTATPPVPDSEQESAHLVGRKRYEVLVAEVGKRVAEDRRLAAEVLQTIPIDQPDLFAAMPGLRDQAASGQGRP